MLDELRKEELGKNHKLLEVKLIYDQLQYKLESFYFWLIDFLRDGLKLNVEKVYDVFGGSVGSYFFGEMGQRFTAVLNTARQLGELINALARSITSILNEYKLLESRIKLYDDIKSSSKNAADAAFKSLKSIWLDNVDSQKGGSSLLNLRARIGFSTIVDLFMLYDIPDKIDYLVKIGIISKELAEELKKRDLNRLREQNVINLRVYNIVKARLEEFYNWLILSEKELRNRLNILRAYLKHQINAFITYTEFAKPYFRFARKLLMKDYNIPDVANVFETAIIELTLLATDEEKEIEYWDDKENKEKKIKYVPLFEINIKFRAMPSILTRGVGTSMYTFFGRTDFEFRAYLLKKEEYEKLKIEEEVRDLMFIQGMTEEFLKNIAQVVFNIFLWDEIQRDLNLKKKVAELLKKDPNEIKKPEDITWSQELIDVIKKEKPGLLGGIEWIKKYLPKKDENKKEEKKGKEKKEKEDNFSIFPFLDSFKSLLESLLEFILVYPKKFRDYELEMKKRKIKEKSEEELNKLKEDTLDKGWKIYEVFKKTFGLLAW